MTTKLAFDKPLDSLGAETLLDNLVRALTADEQRENFDYIARCFDIDRNWRRKPRLLRLG
nr:MAG: hypothetical protein [Bacteriophage sp.]